MNRYRLLTLLVGPVPIVLGSIALTNWVKPASAPPVTRNHVVLRAQDADAQVRTAPPSSETSATTDTLNAACEEGAKELARQLGPGCQTIVRAPFVIGSDLEEAQLESYYNHTIGPAARAMAHSYFDTPPNKPITVLLFSGEQSYNRYARQLYGDEGISVYGYYKPHLRTLVMNIGTGGGTLVHELTHALIDFDFPKRSRLVQRRPGLAARAVPYPARRDRASRAL